MTARPLSPVKLKKHTSSLAGWKTSSDSSHDNTNIPTPSETPSEFSNSRGASLPDLDNLESANMDETKAPGSSLRENVQPNAAEGSSIQNETKTQDAGDAKGKKGSCRKHSKGLKKASKRPKAKAEESSASENSPSSSSSSSSSESEESTEAVSSEEEEDLETIKKRKSKAKKAKKVKELKEKKKAKSRKHKEPSDEEDESETSDDSSSEEDGKRRKLKLKKKKKAKKHRKEVETSDSEEVEEDDPVARAQAHLKALKLRGYRRVNKGGLNSLNDKALKKGLKSKGKKKKRQVSLDRMHAYRQAYYRCGSADNIPVGAPKWTLSGWTNYGTAQYTTTSLRRLLKTLMPTSMINMYSPSEGSLIGKTSIRRQ